MLRLSFLLLVCLSVFAAAEFIGSSRSMGLGRQLKQAPGCGRIFSGTDWAGGDMSGTPIRNLGTPGACCNRCRSRPGCRAYIYRTDTDDCWLKNVVNSPTNCPACAGRNGEEPMLYSCGARYDQDRFGNDMANMPLEGVRTPGACCDHCSSTPGCVAWTWRRDFHRCYLKHTAATLSSCPQCVTGRRR